jgi:hypothetical protein
MGRASSTKQQGAKTATGSMETSVRLSLVSRYSLRPLGIRLVVGIPAILVLLLWILS